jgi:hypothetical protein
MPADWWVVSGCSALWSVWLRGNFFEILAAMHHHGLTVAGVISRSQPQLGPLIAAEPLSTLPKIYYSLRCSAQPVGLPLMRPCETNETLIDINLKS